MLDALPIMREGRFLDDDVRAALVSGPWPARAPEQNVAVRRIRFLEPMQAALLSTRRDHAPQGLDGGHAAKRGLARLIDADGAVRDLPGCFSIDIQPGEAVEIQTPGGGGFGVCAPRAD